MLFSFSTSMDLDRICKLIVNLIKVETSSVNHIHCYGGNRLTFKQAISMLSEAIKELNWSISEYSCVEFEYKPKDLSLAVRKHWNETERFGKPRVIVLSRAEALRRFKKDTLQEIIGMFKNKKCFILMTFTHIPWSKIESGALTQSISRPVVFNIPAVGHESTVDKISTQLGYNKSFVEIVVGIAEPYYTDFELLQHVVSTVAKTCAAKNIDIRGDIKPCANKIINLCKDIKEDFAFPAGIFGKQNCDYLDYARLTKLAIIASYCASYNPPATDRRFFYARKDAAQRKECTKKTRVEHESFHETGPRAFEYQRVFMIFIFFWDYFSTLDSDLKNKLFDLDFNGQIMNLAEYGIVKLVSASESLDQPKYKCLCSFQFANKIFCALSVHDKQDLRAFLYDFAIN
ncbi:origin recognition complex subunit 5 [Ditylenchus destructor]|uniref:Origin recognition complex subunit 5 n=1 Tax=Ditylenchus destructor TaxID=166010 RepID=A0AAD4NDV9_9BILA|nr:origin recognition complex subunit 5 [Ditylenchus destructor]